MIKISKQERNYLVKNGVNVGENGVSRTYTKYPHYYLSETFRNMKMLKEYRESRKVG